MSEPVQTSRDVSSTPLTIEMVERTAKRLMDEAGEQPCNHIGIFTCWSCGKRLAWAPRIDP